MVLHLLIYGHFRYGHLYSCASRYYPFPKCSLSFTIVQCEYFHCASKLLYPCLCWSILHSPYSSEPFLGFSINRFCSQCDLLHSPATNNSTRSFLVAAHVSAIKTVGIMDWYFFSRGWSLCSRGMLSSTVWLCVVHLILSLSALSHVFLHLIRIADFIFYLFFSFALGKFIRKPRLWSYALFAYYHLQFTKSAGYQDYIICEPQV